MLDKNYIKKQRQELVRLEKLIVKTARYVEGHGLVEPMSAWDGTTGSTCYTG